GALARQLPRFLEELADLHLHGLRPVRNGDGVADHEHRPVRHQHRRRRRNDVVPPRRLPPNHPPSPQPKPRRRTPPNLERGQVDARSRDLTRRGVSREALRRLVAAGAMERASRGVYLTPPASRSPHRDLLVVAVRAPNAVFCLLTALAFHRLTTEMPHEVWIALPLTARTPAI